MNGPKPHIVDIILCIAAFIALIAGMAFLLFRGA